MNKNTMERQLEFVEWLKGNGMYNQLASDTTMQHMFEVWEKLIQPKHETVAEWEKRTGKTYPDDGPVWRIEILEDSRGSFTVHYLVTWQQYKPYASPEVLAKWLKLHQPIVATHHGRPDSP